MKSLTIVKIGGNIIDREVALDSFLEDFVRIDNPKVLIHGGGVMASEISAKLEIETTMVDGRRITDFDTLKVVSMVYAGWINKSTVAKLQKLGCNSVGLSGADGDSIPAVRRSPVPVDFGYVGDVNPDEIDRDFITNLLNRGVTPVFCAITHDSNGSLLNTNADTLAASLAVALSRDYHTNLVYCFEKQGVLLNPDDDESVIPLIDRTMYEDLKSNGAIRGGMIPKIDNAFYAIGNGVAEVAIKHASNLNNDKGSILRE